MSSGSEIGGVVGAVVGGVIGYFAGNPVQGAQWGYAIGSAIGGYVDPTKVQGPRLEDASAQTSTVGGIIPFGYGVFTTAGNVIWVDVLKEHKKEERAGKGGSQVNVTFTYTRSYAVGVCKGPISGFVWIKRNGKLVYAANPAALGAAMGWEASQIADLVASSAKFLERCTLHYGTRDQMPDATITAVEGIGNYPPHRGLAYISYENDDLTDAQGAVALHEFCVEAQGIVYATSPPYPILLTEAVDAASYSPSAFEQQWPIEAVDAATDIVDGELRDLLRSYDTEPEAYDCTSDIVDAEYHDLLEAYEIPSEAYDCESDIVDAELRTLLIEYTHEPEAYDCTSDIVSGELT